MKATTFINRRQLMQQLAALSIGTVISPSILLAQKETTSTGKSIYIQPGAGKKGKIGDMDITFKLDKSQTSLHMGLWETIIQPGELGAPPHYHENFDEICRVIEGSIFIMTGDEVLEVKAGGWHLRPKGLVHTFWNSGKKPAKTIDICIPGGHEVYMQELASLFENHQRPQPNDFERLASKYDIHYRFDLLSSIMKKYKVAL